jgi:hypothetical protein
MWLKRLDHRDDEEEAGGIKRQLFHRTSSGFKATKILMI